MESYSCPFLCKIFAQSYPTLQKCQLRIFTRNASVVTVRRSLVVTNGFWLIHCTGKGNVNSYSASSLMSLTCSDMDHTVLPANNTISAFTCKHSPRQRHHVYAHSKRLTSTYYSFIEPKRMNGWVGHVGWHTAECLPQRVTRQLHVMVQARESSQVLDWRSNHCATPPACVEDWVLCGCRKCMTWCWSRGRGDFHRGCHRRCLFCL